MLQLKRVELQGFKSFCDRQEMRFHGVGVAAVVGPNGCGKSNLSDAISWVLGEQSARSLRGSRMEDVIFAGTRDRKPVGMASVTLTLVDPAAHSGVASNGNGTSHKGTPEAGRESQNGEITVTRRLFRSGESEYLINGRTGRLRDIQDIFIGSGLGPESYAIIEQGRIGQILSTRPQDRRAVLEEAAGVTRFRTKKRLAEARLESARGNLTRVFDILEEVGRQLNSLKRQAAKARRYLELRDEMIAQLRIALVGRFRMLEREAAKVALDLNAAATDYSRLSSEVSGKEAAASGMLELSYALEGKLTEARKTLAERRVEAERIRGKLESQAREIASIEQRLSRGESEAQELDNRFQQSQVEFAEYSTRIAGLEETAREARHALERKSEERDRSYSVVRERERSIEASRQLVLRLLGEASGLRNQLGQTEQFLEGLYRDTNRIQHDEQTASAESEKIAAAKLDVSQQISLRQKELEGILNQKAQVEGQLSARHAQAAEARRNLEDLRGGTSRLAARRDSLDEIIRHHSYTTQSVKRLFSAAGKGSAVFQPVGVLADFLDVEPAYEKAAEEFLREELEYVLVKDGSQAEAGLALLRSETEGRATFVIQPETTAEPAVSSQLPTGAVALLAGALRITGGIPGAPIDFIPRLANCFIVESREAAQRLALTHPNGYFLLADGICYHGRAVTGGRKSGSGPLGLKRELRETEGQYNAKKKEFDDTRGLVNQLDLEITSFSDDLERLRGAQNRAEKEAVALDHEMRKLGEEFSRAQSRLHVARNELGRLRGEGTKAEERRESVRALVTAKEAARLEQEKLLAEARAALEELQRESARIGEEHSALRVEQAGFEERLRSHGAARQRIEQQIREMANRKQNLARETEHLDIERSRLLSDNIALGDRATVLAAETGAGDTNVAGLALEESQVRAALHEADEALKATRQQLQGASDRRASFELDLVRKQSELKYLDETCRKELSHSLAEVASDDTLLVLDEAGLVESESRYAELRTKIDALGPVNTQAEEEFNEAQTRYDFLNAQRQDLLDSIRDIDAAIKEIDNESRRRFVDAFEAINANFREMFRTLFTGGMAEMRLTDAENAGESGIDIIAQPPGKKLQSVLLLSGGERALTAMALLMAIFRFQPSPFCVLDEVDAPLDEANIERLARLIREMSASTQFIVITHAKRTMESAQALYGVTMQEPGVSKLVSVKFNPAPPPPPQELAEPVLAAVN